MLPLPLRFWFSLAILCALAPGARADTASRDSRQAAVSALAFGRLPEAAELTAPASAGSTFAAQFAAARARLAADPALRHATAARAWADAFGRAATPAELAALPAEALTYTEHLQHHLAWLAAHPADYRAVIDRATQRVVRRPAFEEEFAYWAAQSDGALSYVLLVGCLDDWARRNQPGLMAASGTPTISPNSRDLAFVRLSRGLAAEVRTAANLPASDDPARAEAAGRNLLAPGAARLTSAGKMHLIAIGAALPPP